MQIALKPAAPGFAASPLRAFARVPIDVLAAGIAFAAVALLQDAANLGHAAHYIYWQDWSDQSKYVASARAFAAGALDPKLHWYPLLYPLGVAAFLWLPLYYAAAAVNLICYGLTYLGFRRIAARFGLSPTYALALFLATTLVGSTLAMSWIVPWTTTLSAALIWLALARVGDDGDPALAPPSPGRLALTGALLGAIPLCRPADLVVSAILALFVLARQRPARERHAGLGALCVGGLAVAAPYLGLHLAIYGPRLTDYMKLSAAFGFDFAHIGWKAETLLVDAGPFFPQGAGMIERLPWLVLGAAGLLAAAFRPDGRRLAALLGLPALAYLVLMLAYADLVPSNLWAFRLIHYFKWLMPLMGLFAVDFVRGFRAHRAASLAALAAILAATSLRYHAVAVASEEPAKLLVFTAPEADRASLMNGRSIISDRYGRLRNLFDYHQATDGVGLAYAEAWRRDFAGDERWSDAPADFVWPAMTPISVAMPAMLGAHGRAPLARYRAEWAIAMPCWIARASCDSALPRPIPPNKP